MEGCQALLPGPLHSHHQLRVDLFHQVQLEEGLPALQAVRQDQQLVRVWELVSNVSFRYVTGPSS